MYIGSCKFQSRRIGHRSRYDHTSMLRPEDRESLLQPLLENGDRSYIHTYIDPRPVSRSRKLFWKLTRAGSGPSPSMTCGLGLLLCRPKAQALAGLIFGLSPHSRPRACPPDQASPAKPDPTVWSPSPTWACTLQARSGPKTNTYVNTECKWCQLVSRMDSTDVNDHKV
jgi:hypothetical protein